MRGSSGEFNLTAAFSCIVHFDQYIHNIICTNEWNLSNSAFWKGYFALTKHFKHQSVLSYFNKEKAHEVANIFEFL